MRYLFGSIADWPTLLKEAYRACKPGGYVESFEASCVYQSDDGSLKKGSPMDEWGKVFVEAGRKFGRPFDVVGEGIVEKAFKEAGFGEAVVWDRKCPIGGWPSNPKDKEIGTFALMGLDSDLEGECFLPTYQWSVEISLNGMTTDEIIGWILFIWTTVMGWTKEEVGVYVAHLRKQLYDKRVHAYVKYRCVYARKPLAE